MLTHVLIDMSSAPWVSTWITKHLGEEYTNCEAKDDILRFTLGDERTKDVSLGTVVKWLQTSFDEDTIYLLYLICLEYGDREIHELIRQALAHLFKCKVGPLRSIWDDGLCTVVWASAPLNKPFSFMQTKLLEDGGTVLKWLPSQELHTLLFTHLKNTAVRTKNV